ncbi:MAG: DUF2330 domain-containing protein [Deltaproteobacteria bacterium]|nr:DUF2330 domain-containing protein [Deltaproteobacteria bacterium]
MKKLMYVTCGILAVMVSAPRPASACGGTFCDGAPNAMPIDQTGENILFVLGDGYTEAHIQIQYDPTAEAAAFAWVVPMTAIPEFAVGSQRLFDNVLASTVPSYGFNVQTDDCGPVADASGEAGGDGAGDGGTGGDSTGDGETGPTVVVQQTVGAFEVAVLQGGSADEVMQWLGSNGFAQDPAAEPILAEYLAENYVFAAFKLQNGAETSEIHPVVLRFASDEACVPLRLTRIAAVDDMHVRTFFLAEHRVVPQNYRHVVVNPLRLDWPALAANYADVITLAVDAFGAEGKAFVTEYAGPSARVSPAGIHEPSWDPDAFVGLAAVDAVATLAAQGFGECDGSACGWTHPLVAGLLASYLPVPDGRTAEAFYGCLSCYEAEIDADAWGDGSGFAAALRTRIVEPGQHALGRLAQFPTLTRMFTTISPAEMTADPFFWQNPDLPEVDQTAAFATRRLLCNDDALWTLPDGREVYVPNDGPWPAFSDTMPWEQEVAEVGSQGAPVVLVDNKATIDTMLATYNCGMGWPASLCGSGGAGDTGGTGSTGDTGGGDGGGPGSGESSGSGTAGLDDDAQGCGCTASRSPTHAWTGAVVLLVAARRRRSRRVSRGS